jgi:hypothetical protein
VRSVIGPVVPVGTVIYSNESLLGPVGPVIGLIGVVGKIGAGPTGPCIFRPI